MTSGSEQRVCVVVLEAGGEWPDFVETDAAHPISWAVIPQQPDETPAELGLRAQRRVEAIVHSGAALDTVVIAAGSHHNDEIFAARCAVARALIHVHERHSGPPARVLGAVDAARHGTARPRRAGRYAGRTGAWHAARRGGALRRAARPVVEPVPLAFDRERQLGSRLARGSRPRRAGDRSASLGYAPRRPFRARSKHLGAFHLRRACRRRSPSCITR